MDKHFEEWFQKNPEGFWREFQRTRHPGMRDFLICKYLPIVKYQAERLKHKLHDKLELDDLQQVGVLGLMQAIEHYDPDRLVKFETYCSARIHGSILDDLRSRDWVPRRVRKKAKDWDQARQALVAKLGREPKDQEMADSMNLSLEKYYEMAQEASAATILSMESGDDSDAPSGLESIPDPRAEDPAQIVAQKNLIQSMLENMEEVEQKIIYLYYNEELTMKEIGEVLNLSESRVSQIHSLLKNRLKAKFSKDIVHLWNRAA